MELAEGGWPRNRWKLSAPESHALLYGPGRHTKQPFKLAVLELITRRALALVEERGAFGKRKAAVLTAGPEGGRAPERRPLAAVLGLHREATLQSYPDGVPVAELARAAVKRYGSLRKFTQAEVMAALADRGLYRREEYRVLWIFPSTRWALTPTGEAARAELEGTAKLGERSFGEWVDREPARALAFLGVAGSSVLLMDALHPALQRLREEQAAAGYAGGAYIGSPGGDTDETLGDPTPDPGFFDLGSFDPGALDFGALGDLGGALDSIDAGVDAGGGGGGDWGGGGDGGGDGGGGGGGGGG